MPENRNSKRRWRNYLVDVRYQATFTLPMVLVAAALFAGLGHVAMRKAESATKIGITQIEATGTYLENAADNREALLNRERAIGYGIVVVGILLCLGLASFGLVLSHKVAGPLYRLRVELGKLRDGSFAPVAPLRAGDSLIDFYDRFRKAHDAMRVREQRDVHVFRRVIEAAEQEGTKNTEQLATLRARLEAKEAGLG